MLAAAVNEYPEVFTDPQVLHNELVVETEHPVIGPLRFVGLPIKLSATPGQIRLSPPTVGQHNEFVLARLGYSTDAIQHLRDEGAIGAESERERETQSLAWGDSATAS